MKTKLLKYNWAKHLKENRPSVVIPYKDRLWIAYYLNVNGINSYDVRTYINEFINTLSCNDGTVEQIFIPITEGESRVECVYDPTGNSSEKYEEFFVKANEYINKFLNKEEDGTTTEESTD